MRPAKTLILALAALGLAAPAQADVYKCTINGEIRYQDAPCPGQGDQKPHLEIKDQAPPPPPPSSPQASIPSELPVAPEAEGTLDDPNFGSAGGESTPAQLRAAFEAEAEARRNAPPAPPRQGPPEPPDRLTELQARIEAAQARHRQLLREQREAMRALAEKHAGQEDSEAAIAEQREADYTWRQRRLEAADRERGLRAELERLCPNGTLNTRGRIACR